MQSEFCYSCFLRGHKSTVCKNAPGKEWNLNGEKTFKKPEWWDSKIPGPALKQKQKKKVKKCNENELEDAANKKDNLWSENEGNNSSEEDSEGHIVNIKIKKATEKKKVGMNALRVNIK